MRIYADYAVDVSSTQSETMCVSMSVCVRVCVCVCVGVCYLINFSVVKIYTRGFVLKVLTEVLFFYYAFVHNLSYLKITFQNRYQFSHPWIKCLQRFIDFCRLEESI